MGATLTEKNNKGTQEVMKKGAKSRMKTKTRDLLLMFSPGFLILIIFCYLPMFGLVIAFKDYRFDEGIFNSKWVGFKNFEFLFTSQDAMRITCNTVFLNMLFIITLIIGGVLLAIILNEVKNRTVVKIYQTAMFFPYFLSWAVVSFMVYGFLNADLGIVNKLLEAMGQEPILWYNEASIWPGLLVLISFWKGIGYNCIIFYAGLMSIDTSYYESAVIDGANKVQMMFKITLPLLMPHIIIMTILHLGNIFRSDFGLFYMVTRNSGALYVTTDVIDTYVFRSLRVVGDIGMSSAVGFYQSVVGFLTVVTANWIVKKIDSDNAIF